MTVPTVSEWCPWCKSLLPLNADGTFETHKGVTKKGKPTVRNCKASGKTLLEARSEMAS